MSKSSRLLELGSAIALAAFWFAAYAGDCRDEVPAEVLGLDRMPIATLTERAEAGDASAQNELGRRLGIGIGIARDPARSFSWYEKAAAQEHCTAQANLAYMYFNGEGVAKDAKLAEAWYTKASGHGSDRARYALGYMYVTGKGVEKNGSVAEKWFLMAANDGYVPAQRALMTMYEKGEGVPQDLAKAALWLHRVRDAGLTGKPWKQGQ